MKKNIHPKLHPVIFIDVTTKEEYQTMSTLTSEQTKIIDGITYYVIPVQISSSSHPFYTGKHRIIDTENLVKKFEQKTKKSQSLAERLKASKEKKKKRRNKVNEVKETQMLTLKDMLKQMQ